MRVLVIADSNDRIDPAVTALRQAGIESVQEMEGAIGLLRRVADFQPDVILIDTASPSRDVLESLCVVNSHAPRPMLMFSADDSDDSIAAALAAGVTVYSVEGINAQRLGPERARGMNPYASLNRAGVALAFGSDSPVTGFGPWAAVRAAAHHHTHTERLTVRAAFNAHTRGGWRAARRDDGGVIAPGAPASVAVWDVPGELRVQTPDPRVAAWSTDPRAGVPHLPDLQPDTDLPACVMTIVRGQVAYEEPGALR